MGQTTTIEWTATVNKDGSVTPGSTWNPVRGCSRVSEGCRHCYAERTAARFAGRKKVNEDPPVFQDGPFLGFVQITNGHPQWTGKVELVKKHLDDPLHWRRSRRIFVNSMSDMFHEALPFSQIDRIFTVMAAADWHTYLILTKRSDRLLEYVRSGRHDDGYGPDRADYHLDQAIWLGVSVENKLALSRIDALRQVPAEVRFLSIEPLLEDLGVIDLTGIHLVIVGGESGPGARPMHPGWVRSIRDQCIATGTPFFFKQWGNWTPDNTNAKKKLRLTFQGLNGSNLANCVEDDAQVWMSHVGKGAAGRLLDGREWNEMPISEQEAACQS